MRDEPGERRGDARHAAARATEAALTRPRSDTSRAIVDIAERHVMERGYHAFSFADIADELGVKPAAVHYHFRTKPDLVVALLARYRARFARWAESVAALPAPEQLDRYVELSRVLVRDGRIDPYGTLSAEARELPEPVLVELRELRLTIFGWFAGLLRAGEAAGTLQVAGPPDAVAATLACALLGAQQLGRVAGATAFEEVAEQVRRTVALR